MVGSVRSGYVEYSLQTGIPAGRNNFFYQHPDFLKIIVHFSKKMIKNMFFSENQKRFTK
jgi:hypothetical protein